MTVILIEFILESKREGKSFHSFNEANLILIPQLDEDSTKNKHPSKEDPANTASSMNLDTTYPQQNIHKSNQAMDEKNYIPLTNGIFSRNKRLAQHLKINLYYLPYQQAIEDKSYEHFN